MKSKSFTLKNWLIPVSTGTHAASYIEVIVVKTSGEIIEIKVGNDNLSDVRNIIGGKCEAIMMGNLGFCFVNAEGERLGLPVNHKASGILHRALKKPIEIVGDAVFMSYADKNGDYVNISQKFIDFIKKWWLLNSFKAWNKQGGSMKTVKLDGVIYKLTYDEIFIGDDVYNPLSGCIMVVDEEDDLEYVNDYYYKIKEKPVKPKFFKY